MSFVRFKESSYLVMDGKKYPLRALWSSAVVVAVDSRQILTLLNKIKPSKVEFIHTHPRGASKPSLKDIKYKKTFKRICDRRNVISKFYIKCRGGLYEY